MSLDRVIDGLLYILACLNIYTIYMYIYIYICIYIHTIFNYIHGIDRSLYHIELHLRDSLHVAWAECSND